MRLVAILTFMAMAVPASVSAFTFGNIDGGTHDLTDWRGQPVLVVNTASRCGFTPQYQALQTLYDTYRDAGLVVLAVPSNDFRQELSTAAEVKQFCEVNFDLTLPMTDITHVKGPEAHAFYRWLASEGFVPRWNFNKALIGPDGSLVASFGSRVPPDAPQITQEIEDLLR